jgi:CRP/FNR family transcriptional regulator, cyclic AMP receptor protein
MSAVLSRPLALNTPPLAEALRPAATPAFGPVSHPHLRPDELAGIQAGEWFMALPPALRQSILVRAYVRRLPAGAVLSRRGDIAGDWFGVASGALSLASPLADGRSFMLDLVGPGRWYGDIALVDGKPQDLDISAHCASTVLTVPRADLRWLLSQSAELREACMQLNCVRLRRMFRRFEEFHTQPLHQRVARQVQRLARHFGRRTGQGVCIDLAVSQGDLAEMLGASRQRINGTLRQMHHRGIVEAGQARMRVLDEALLEAVASGKLALSGKGDGAD